MLFFIAFFLAEGISPYGWSSKKSPCRNPFSLIFLDGWKDFLDEAFCFFFRFPIFKQLVFSNTDKFLIFLTKLVKVCVRHSYSFDVQVWLEPFFMDEVDDERPGHGEGNKDDEPEGIWFSIER